MSTATPETLTTTVAGATLYADVWGEGDPVLLVHGFPLSGLLWQHVMPAMGPGFRYIVPDQRGHGRSGISPTLTMARLADDLAAWLGVLGSSRPVVLIGMSMGGYVGFEFCRRHPQRLRAFVATNTRAQADPPHASRDRLATAARLRDRGGSHLVARAMVPTLFGPTAPESLRSLWFDRIAATPPESVAATLEAMAARPDSFDTLAALDCPVLVIAGEHDTLTPREDAERMRDAAPHGRLAVVADSGHMTPVENPRGWAEAANAFLRSLATA